MNANKWILILKVCTACAAIGAASGLLVGGMCLLPYHRASWLEGLRVILYLLSWLPTVFFWWLWLLHVYGVTFMLSLTGVVLGVKAQVGNILLRWSLSSLVLHLVLVVTNTYIYDNISQGSVLRFVRLLMLPSLR